MVVIHNNHLCEVTCQCCLCVPCSTLCHTPAACRWADQCGEILRVCILNHEPTQRPSLKENSIPTRLVYTVHQTLLILIHNSGQYLINGIFTMLQWYKNNYYIYASLKCYPAMLLYISISIYGENLSSIIKITINFTNRHHLNITFKLSNYCVKKHFLRMTVHYWRWLLLTHHCKGWWLVWPLYINTVAMAIQLYALLHTDHIHWKIPTIQFFERKWKSKVILYHYKWNDTLLTCIIMTVSC